MNGGGRRLSVIQKKLGNILLLSRCMKYTYVNCFWEHEDMATMFCGGTYIVSKTGCYLYQDEYEKHVLLVYLSIQ